MNPARRGLLVLLASMAFTPATAAAAAADPPPPPAPAPAPAEVVAALPDARLQGQGRLRFLGLHVYDARLWTGVEPVGALWGQMPLALELVYARRLAGAQIADRSLAEMQRQGEIDAAQGERWLAQLRALIPDVAAGDRLSAVARPGRALRLYANGVLRGELADAELVQRFLGIWLAPQSSQPALRQALLGKAAG